MADANQQDPNQQPQDQAQATPVSGEEEMTIGKYKVKIVRKDCIGAATCVAVSPGVFKLDAENIAVFVEGANDSPENIVAAAQGCPTKAIYITDTESGEQVWPK